MPGVKPRFLFIVINVKNKMGPKQKADLVIINYNGLYQGVSIIANINDVIKKCIDDISLKEVEENNQILLEYFKKIKEDGVSHVKFTKDYNPPNHVLYDTDVFEYSCYDIMQYNRRADIRSNCHLLKHYVASPSLIHLGRFGNGHTGAIDISEDIVVIGCFESTIDEFIEGYEAYRTFRNIAGTDNLASMKGIFYNDILVKDKELKLIYDKCLEVRSSN